MEKFLLFTTGGGSADCMAFSNDEAALYNARDLRSIKPASKSSIELYFRSENSDEIVTLIILAGSHTRVMRSIAEAIASQTYLIKIADVDANSFIDRNIIGVSIKAKTQFIQVLANNSRTKLNVTSPGDYSSCIITNIDGIDAVDLTLELYDGSTYTKLLSTVSIPADTTLKLEADEISFDDSTYDLYATSGDSGGQLTFTFNY